MNPPVTNGRLVEGISDETDRVLLVNQIRDGVLNQQVNAWPKVLTTTDATPTFVWTDSMPADSVADLECVIVGQQVGSPGTVAGYRRRCVAVRVGTGAVTLLGAVDTIGADHESVGAWDATFALDAANPGNINASVTGAVATTIKWRANVTGLVYPWS